MEIENESLKREIAQLKESQMSYSVFTPCGSCNKKKACTDGVVVTGAVQGIIHAMPFGVGHLGSGKVTLYCQNFEVIPGCDAEKQAEEIMRRDGSE
jgi:hypothetical protein